MEDFTTDFGRDGRMLVRCQQLKQGLFLFATQVAFVTLAKRQQRLVPQDGHCPFVHLEPVDCQVEKWNSRHNQLQNGFINPVTTPLSYKKKLFIENGDN